MKSTEGAAKKSGLLVAMGLGLLGVAAVAAAPKVIRRGRRLDFDNKVVMITGGSRGLGLEIARKLLREGATVALLARDRDELRRAEEILEGFESRVFTFKCDVTDQAQVNETVARVELEVGKISVLFNNAGLIQAGPMETQTISDYKRTMDTHFWGPLYATLAVVPGMKERNCGRIVNISSIAGLVSVPHLLPYCASKHALVGLSEGMRSELLKDNVFVTTVCPGLMRTGSHINAEFKGQNKKEFALFSLMDSLPVTSIDSAQAAGEIVEACRYGDDKLVITMQARAAEAFHALSSGFVSDVFGLVNIFLPGPGKEPRMDAVKGAQSKSSFSPSFMTKLADDASVRNNELGSN
jgi:NAD(P)-dependent dehydrogenase (short-subunit alcohol dehydrogenase family)